LFVVSDLHLGGIDGFQIFNSGEEFLKFTDYITKLSPQEKIALVVNGDLVDFLAESNAIHFDPIGAVDKLDRIMEDNSFSMVFKGLQKFVSTENRSLIINLGNHDLELALPWVRSHLLDALSGQNIEAKGRITFIFDGTGFACRVGNAKIICLHGNEVDEWNVADYEMIRRIGREIMQGRPVKNWIPNAGTQLVIDIMNELKHRFPFIDLLKPEMQGVIPTILALAPEQQGKIMAIAATASRLLWDKFKLATGLLNLDNSSLVSIDDFESKSEYVVPSANFYRDSKQAAPDNKKYAEVMLEKTELRFLKNVNPITLIDPELLEENLGLFFSIRKLIQGEERSEVLREALQGLLKDESFNFKEEDETYRRLDSQVGDEFAFVIAGHTHLAKAIKRKNSNGIYYNSGTWVRLIKLEPEILQSKEGFKQVFDAFQSGTIKALDTFPAHKSLVIRKLTVVNISINGEKTCGILQEMNLEKSGEVLSDISGSEFSYSN
jgi:UDP-2,3-diacylglucosamine pyrophosphatase LpxH